MIKSNILYLNMIRYGATSKLGKSLTSVCFSSQEGKVTYADKMLFNHKIKAGYGETIGNIIAILS